MNTRPTRHWRCISGCGACCRLDPSLRPEALEALDAEQRQRYLSMVGADGWCLHYDTGTQRCRIYAERPDFCRVANLGELFGQADQAGVPAAGTPVHPGLDELAIRFCLQQIRAESGGRGNVMRRFLRAIRQRP
ncbi:MAG: YkgJ family cysteine cluster protein [Synechococcaceae cyanobacterium]|nr:YkgJ family cysteine cluster protein [Synechococcaceae cyanobacterium]